MSDGKKRVLIVDDEVDIRTFLQTLCEDNGYDTELAVDGNEAMEKVKKNRPDLITLDISMPEKSGIKFYRELKGDADLGKIPVIVVTGVTGFGGSSEEFRKFLESRKQIPKPEGFIDKPIDKDKLLEMMKKYL